ncbi:restriction endonuclease subunit S [Lactococcus lactis]|nr:restriction endonuclease subunit S [Lactococcus lactis]
MEGKLVSQDPDDEPASELLKRIKAEKEKLIKEGKIKRDKNETEIFRGDDGLHYEKFADGTVKQVDVPFEIPESWEWVRLSTISSKIHYGYTASAKEVGNAKLLRITDIQNNQVNWETVPYCDISLDKLPNMQVVKNDILIARTGGTIGKSFLIQNVTEVAVFASYLIRVQMVVGNVSDFVKTFIESPNYWVQLQEMSMGTGQPNVNATNLSTLLIPVAPIAEQERIFSRIDELERNIQQYSDIYQALEKLNKEFPEKLRKSILQYAMQGKLVPQNPNDEPVEVLLEKIRQEKQKLYEEGKLKKKDLEESIIYKGDDNSYYENIPETWVSTTLGNIGVWGAGATPSRSNPKYYGGSIPWLKTGDLTDGYITEIPEYITELALEKTSVKLNPTNSVLIAMYGATIGKLGILTFPVATNQACCACQPIPPVNNWFLFYYLMSIRRHFIDSAEGGAQPNISRIKIVNTPFPMPSYTEQARIVSQVEKSFDLINLLPE